MWGQIFVEFIRQKKCHDLIDDAISSRTGDPVIREVYARSHNNFATMTLDFQKEWYRKVWVERAITRGDDLDDQGDDRRPLRQL